MMEAVIILMRILLPIFLFGIVYFFGRPIWWGAPYAPSDEGKIRRMVTLARIQKGEKALDIGSGDGRVVIELAKAGAHAFGYEVNPVLWAVSSFRIRRSGLQNVARIYRKNFWRADFSPFDVVTIFGVTYIMPELEKKLLRELQPGARVVSNYFSFPTWKPDVIARGVYVYQKK